MTLADDGHITLHQNGLHRPHRAGLVRSAATGTATAACGAGLVAALADRGWRECAGVEGAADRQRRGAVPVSPASTCPAGPVRLTCLPSDCLP
jgi:hypothetical protein